MLQLQGEDISPKWYVLPRGYFNALSAGRGGPEVVNYLWNTQKSRRLLLIAMLFDEAEQFPSLCAGLPPADAARRVLAAAQARKPADIDKLLLNPQVGAWAAFAMRRRLRHAPGSGDAPLWVDLGGLHALSFVAAAKAELDWETSLPHRQGDLLLFGMGMAHFSGIESDELIRAGTVNGRITLKAGDSIVTLDRDARVESGQFWESRFARTGIGTKLDVCLDDLDPLRDLADPVAPAPMDDTAVARWQTQLDEAWALLCKHHAERAEAIAAGVVSVVPLPLGDGRETRSASSGESFGRIMVSPPSDATTLAVALVHEFQHIKLGGLMHLTKLTEDDETARHYAPWRDDPRPIGGLLQGVYAFFGIAEFWRAHRNVVSGIEERLANFEYAYARCQAREGIGVVRASGALTDEGSALIDGLSARVESWLEDELDRITTSAMRVVADYHRTGWRLRHQQVGAEELNAALHAWHDNAPAALESGPPRVASAPPIRWSYKMIELARRRILEPTTWRNFARAEDGWSAKIHNGDLALFDGDAETAVTSYVEAMHDDRANLGTWTGLAVAMDRTVSAAAARALGSRPELVRALYLVLAESGSDPDPVKVATWLGAALPTG